MRVLLDTHTFLWWISDDERLSLRVREIISNRHNTLLVSAASGWEMAIKLKLGKLKLAGSPEPFITDQIAINAFEILPIQMHHALHVYTLLDHHRDPFDRMLIAQSQLENLPILTSDPHIAL
ncbi:MAG: type II toxin-antitoxin system VapC family toxin [Proteobacteria bacterium]|nr:type II toxin-antitoxin system VapC family toxin [Pseudomonadota bacterium]MBU4448157.1 type II toxin-antitoxin system VapC family toxin [Pseudomonadota bacterium]